MQTDLNDLYFFAQVAEQGGFAAASRITGIPKSRLSRRIATLEEHLGVRLLQRSSRQFSLTEIGQVYLRHCQAMLAEAQAAHESISHVQAEPRGQIRVSCPTAMIKVLLSSLVTEFMLKYPQVTVFLEASNRRVDLIEEGFDVAIRVRNVIEDSALVLRSFGQGRAVLVASPALLQSLFTPATPDDLVHFPTLSAGPKDGKFEWILLNQREETRTIEIKPRLIVDDFDALRVAAIAGLGVVCLPEFECIGALKQGQLIRLLPDWFFQKTNVHAVYPSRRGLVPAVRAFLDFLALRLPQLINEHGFD